MALFCTAILVKSSFAIIVIIIARKATKKF